MTETEREIQRSLTSNLETLFKVEKQDYFSLQKKMKTAGNVNIVKYVVLKINKICIIILLNFDYRINQNHGVPILGGLEAGEGGQCKKTKSSSAVRWKSTDNVYK